MRPRRVFEHRGPHPWAAGLATLALSGCAAESRPVPSARVAVEVAPLALTGITEGCYELTVTNAPGGNGDVVWSKVVCSTQYGDGQGAISYVGPCDADVAQKNTVRLELLSLSTAEGPAAFVNPCGAPDNAPCQVEASCEPNRDTPVVFDLTIMRPASQGFFDVAVNFDDVFCSAKLDCQPNLLHWPHDPDGEGPIEEGTRGPTAVVAFACTAGPGQDTTLYWGDAAVVCGEGEGAVTYPVDPSLGAGQHGPIAGRGVQTTRPGIYQHAIYRGAEGLSGLDKCYWNLALGLDATALGAGCRFVATATAGSTPLDALVTRPGVVYPVLEWEVPLTGPTGALTCGAHPLGAPGSGVTTTYKAGDALRFSTFAGCGEEPTFIGRRLDCAPTLGSGLAVRTDGEGRFYATYGGQEVGPFDLPEGAVLADSCCVDACCASVEVP